MIGELPWSWSTLVKYDRQQLEKSFRKTIKSLSKDPKSPPTVLDEYRKRLDLLPAVEIFLQKIQAREDFQKYVMASMRVENKISDLQGLAREISNSEKLIYDQLYRVHVDQGPNPCRDFTL